MIPRPAIVETARSPGNSSIWGHATPGTTGIVSFLLLLLRWRYPFAYSYQIRSRASRPFSQRDPQCLSCCLAFSWIDDINTCLMVNVRRSANGVLADGQRWTWMKIYKDGHPNLSIYRYLSGVCFRCKTRPLFTLKPNRSFPRLTNIHAWLKDVVDG